jgi:hypothetical protein
MNEIKAPKLVTHMQSTEAYREMRGSLVNDFRKRDIHKPKNAFGLSSTYTKITSNELHT